MEHPQCKVKIVLFVKGWRKEMEDAHLINTNVTENV